jgi:hypothetical protein
LHDPGDTGEMIIPAISSAQFGQVIKKERG